ncbi:MAG: competence/damage-inducible protein A [Pirellulaceae bacterium]|nr:competence/damage-inducible protein A [Pirellulaceae bacterium]
MTQRNSNDSSTGSHLTAEVVSIGDEMTSGARLDTNAQWLSQRIRDLGVEVAFHSTVGDTLAHNVDVFRIAADRADIIVSTGGLGPTRDDLTREALAGLVDRPLVLSDSALEHIESMFSKRKREMPERNRLQAMFPEGSVEIYNPQGTAPGIDLAISRDGRSDSRIFALPGVPAEMKRMFDDTVADRIMQLAGGGKFIAHSVMKFFGTGESDMEQRLGDMIARDRQPRVGITVSSATISLRISASAENLEHCTAMIATTRAEILERVGDLHYGDGEHFEQHHAIDQTLCQRDESLLVIELGRAAPLGDWFASLEETKSYRGGLSLADTSDVCSLAGTSDETAALAKLRDQFQADWLLMVDGYPQLDHGSDKPLPPADVRLVILPPSGPQIQRDISLGGHPSILQQRIAKAAMQWFRETLKR